MLGEKLLKLRKKFGYSQQELADKLSVTRQTISNWACGQGAPTIEERDGGKADRYQRGKWI